MHKQRKQNSTNQPVCFFMTDNSDHVTGKTGLTPTVTLSKNGGAFGAASGAVSEIGNGWYALAGNATDRNTLGELALHATASGADPFDGAYEIVQFDPFADPTTARLGNLDNLDRAISTAESNVRGTDGDDLKDISDQLDTAQTDLDTPDQYKADVSNLDVAISTRAPASEYDTELAAIQADLDNPDQYKADLTTVLARIGAFTGSGVNTILGLLKALASKAASTPSDVGGTFSPATDSVEAIRDLLNSTTVTVVAAVDGGEITLPRGDTWEIDLTVGDISDRGDGLWFTLKESPSAESDDAALIKVEESAGLQRCNGAAPSASGNGSITVSDEVTGALQVIVAAVETAKLSPKRALYWDIQRKGADGVHTVSEGTFIISVDVTRGT